MRSQRPNQRLSLTILWQRNQIHMAKATPPLCWPTSSRHNKAVHLNFFIRFHNTPYHWFGVKSELLEIQCLARTKPMTTITTTKSMTVIRTTFLLNHPPSTRSILRLTFLMWQRLMRKEEVKQEERWSSEEPGRTQLLSADWMPRNWDMKEDDTIVCSGIWWLLWKRYLRFVRSG